MYLCFTKSNDWMHAKSHWSHLNCFTPGRKEFMCGPVNTLKCSSSFECKAWEIGGGDFKKYNQVQPILYLPGENLELKITYLSGPLMTYHDQASFNEELPNQRTDK